MTQSGWDTPLSTTEGAAHMPVPHLAGRRSVILNPAWVELPHQFQVTLKTFKNTESRDTSVGTSTGFDSRNGEKIFPLSSVQTSSVAHPGYPVGTGGSFPGDKAAG
jgi:hypothetical protein